MQKTSFQTFNATTSPQDGPPRLAALRAKLSDQGLTGFLVPRADVHQGEYVAPRDERLAWLTGFTGSAGFAAILADIAGVFTDGRYRLQVRSQTAPEFTAVDFPETKLAPWLIEQLPQGGSIGFDPWLHTGSEIQKLEAALTSHQITLRPVANAVDAIWTDRPEAPNGPAQTYPDALAGRTSAEKRTEIAETLRESGAEAVVLTLPDSINWLLNIRGSDLSHLPVVQCFAILKSDGAVHIFSDPQKFNALELGSDVTVDHWDNFEPALCALSGPVFVDPATAPVAVSTILEREGVAIQQAPDPCLLPKARKTPAEIAATTTAHERDGVAMARFLHWFETSTPGDLTEIDVAKRLEAFRAETGALKDISFDTISGAGANGAIVHYRVTEETNAPLTNNSVFLIDSGAQYQDGTTDITRTLAIGDPGETARHCATLVLQGMIAIHRARFPKGIQGTHLDALARAPLWAEGRDYDHGTGHGVGVYLGVHEGPQRLSRASPIPFEPGMILSNEPGYYREGEFGIRIENLIYVVPAPQGADPAREMLAFETLTLAPIDRRLIKPSMLAPAELDWLNAYHNRVLSTIGPKLSEAGHSAAAEWLVRACAAV